MGSRRVAAGCGPTHESSIMQRLSCPDAAGDEGGVEPGGAVVRRTRIVGEPGDPSDV